MINELENQVKQLDELNRNFKKRNEELMRKHEQT